MSVELVTPSSFGTLLVRYRRARNFSQHQLGRACGVTASMVSRVESGARTPSRKLVNALADSLRLTEIERVRFYEAAGLSNSGIVNVLSGYQELIDIYYLLSDTSVDDGIKDIVRASLRTMIALKDVYIAPFPLINPRIGHS